MVHNLNRKYNLGGSANVQSERHKLERIAIVGLGPIGTSIGLALKGVGLKNTEVIGQCSDRDILSIIKKINAFDDVVSGLDEALEGAQLIVIDSPVSETRDILQSMSPYVSDDAVVTDTGNSKVRCSVWAEEFLPDTVAYIGGRPIVKNYDLKLESSSGQLFKDNYYCIMPSEKADEQAIKTVVSMVEAIGAIPYFLDPVEHDSYSAAVDVLPMVISAAFVNTTAGSASWKEMYKTASGAFDQQSMPSSDDPIDAETQCLTVSQPLIHWIDQMILSMHKIRSQLSEDSDDLIESFITAWEQRARWETGAIGDDDSRPALPTAGESMASVLLGDKLAKRFTKLGDADKRSSWKYPRTL